MTETIIVVVIVFGGTCFRFIKIFSLGDVKKESVIFLLQVFCLGLVGGADLRGGSAIACVYVVFESVIFSIVYSKLKKQKECL